MQCLLMRRGLREFNVDFLERVRQGRHTARASSTCVARETNRKRQLVAALGLLPIAAEDHENAADYA
jgi:hypothetical protein